MLVDGLVVRRSLPEDAATLAAFAAGAFQDAFGAQNTPEDMAAYLREAYGEQQQRQEIANPDIATLMVERSDTLIAFAQVRRSDPPPCVTVAAPVELWRFYVDRAWHGQGIAHTLMQSALAAAAELGGEFVWLSVWERNPRALAFYAKCGFRDVGSNVFVVGTDRQTDRVLLRIVLASSV